MLIFLIFILILAVIIYLPINAAVSYYFFWKAGSDDGVTSLMTSRKVNMAALAVMIVLSVVAFFTMAFVLDGSCAGSKSHVCVDFTTAFIAVPFLIGMFSLFLLSGLWFFGREPEKIEPPSILN